MAVIRAIGNWLPRLYNSANLARASNASSEVKVVYTKVGEPIF